MAEKLQALEDQKEMEEFENSRKQTQEMPETDSETDVRQPKYRRMNATCF